MSKCIIKPYIEVHSVRLIYMLPAYSAYIIFPCTLLLPREKASEWIDLRPCVESAWISSLLECGDCGSRSLGCWRHRGYLSEKSMIASKATAAPAKSDGQTTFTANCKKASWAYGDRGMRNQAGANRGIPTGMKQLQNPSRIHLFCT